MDEVGTQPLTVVATPAPEETRTENNARTLAINVADDKAKVLLIDGEARWEYHYLASALARDHGTETKSVVFAQPRTGRLSESDVARLGIPPRDTFRPKPKLWNLRLRHPRRRDAGATVARRPRPAGTVRRERGGTLVVLAGQRAMPAAFFGADRCRRTR